MTVKRYEPMTFKWGADMMVLDTDGEYVLASDYDTLKKDLLAILEEKMTKSDNALKPCPMPRCTGNAETVTHRRVSCSNVYCPLHDDELDREVWQALLRVSTAAKEIADELREWDKDAIHLHAKYVAVDIDDLNSVISRLESITEPRPSGVVDMERDAARWGQYNADSQLELAVMQAKKYKAALSAYSDALDRMWGFLVERSNDCDVFEKAMRDEETARHLCQTDLRYTKTALTEANARIAELESLGAGNQWHAEYLVAEGEKKILEEQLEDAPTCWHCPQLRDAEAERDRSQTKLVSQKAQVARLTIANDCLAAQLIDLGADRHNDSKRCVRCDLPKATDDDLEQYEPGDGNNLCWCLDDDLCRGV